MRRAEIIERLEKAEGFDRELDLEIGFAVDGWRLEMVEGSDREMVYVPCDKTYYANHPGGMYPSFTDSLDATIALVERTLPGWGFYLRSDKEGNGCGLVYPDAFRVTPCHCMGATPALAVLTALFRALEAKETGNRAKGGA